MVAATVIAALVAPAVASASDWYVSKQGDDSHTCSSPAAIDACLTIQHAGGVAQSGDATPPPSPRPTTPATPSTAHVAAFTVVKG